MRYAASGRRSGSSWIEAIKVNDCRQIPSWVLGESGYGAIVTPRGRTATATPNPLVGRGHGHSLLPAVARTAEGGTQQATLGLPWRVKERVHKVIRRGLTARSLAVGSLSVGLPVSILESLCTGQVYLPTIVFVTGAPGMQAAAVGYLLLYNVMFVVPLLAILAATYLGLRSETLGNLLRKRLALAKFGMAGLFAALGFLVMVTV